MSMFFRTLASGSKGNSAVLSRGGTHILIDAGTSARRIRAGLSDSGLKPEDISAIVITHDHTDHISALPRLINYIDAPVFAPPKTAAAILRSAPCLSGRVEPMAAGDCVKSGEVTFRSFATPHDAADSVGYVFTDGIVKFSYATDTGEVTETMLEACLGADMAVIEANHDREMLLRGRYPDYLKKRILSPRGHLSNDDSGDFAALLWREGAGKLLLAHLSEENNVPALSLRCVGEKLMSAGAVPGRDVCLSCAPAGTPSEVFEVEKCSV